MGAGTTFTEQEIGDLAGPVRVIAARAGAAIMEVRSPTPITRPRRRSCRRSMF
ncbi:MAG: hypothetical protein O7D27_05685 [Alphaproteobacteria bacterium]|nr:hypothetical protein [Alphaproteobacteria bacterium]